MKFSMYTKELQDALAIANKSVGKINPVIKGFKLNCLDTGLEVTTTDLNSSIQTFVPSNQGDKKVMEINRTGSIVISHLLDDIVKKLPSERTEIEIKDEGNVAIRSGKSEFNLSSISSEEFPKINFPTGSVKLLMEINDLEEIIDKTLFAASDSETRPVLTGINVLLTNNELLVQSTDSYRFTQKVGAFTRDGEFNVIIPKESLKKLKTLPNFSKENGEIEIEIGENQISYKLGNTTFYSRLLDGKFPTTAQIIPKNFTTTVTVNRKDLLQIADRVSILFEAKKETVKFKFTPTSIELTSSQPEIGKMVETLEPIEFDGEEIKIAINGRYLKDALKAFCGEHVNFEFNGPTKPIKLTDNDDPKFFQLLLPIRTY